MTKKIVLGIVGLLIGAGFGYLFILRPSFLSFQNGKTVLFTATPERASKNEIIGFLPYWLASKADPDYSPYITQLAYFSLSIDTDGHIQKLTSPVEAEPGWYALSSGKMDDFLKTAKKNDVELSLTVFSGDADLIDQLITTPTQSATNLASDILPVMKEHGFTNINLDIENTREASQSARDNFTIFAKAVEKQLKKIGATMTVDITGSDLLRPDMIDPKKMGEIADHVMVMTYDYHFAGSIVTGPVAPLGGAGTIAEYDVKSAIQKAKAVIPSKKIILGAPVYGYEWETLGNTPRSGIIPGTGITASTKRVQELLSACSTCSAELDSDALEQYLIYQDTETNTYHQIFYPDQKSTQAKVDFAKHEELGGIGMWALGYEGKELLNPLKEYKESL
ncbi:hypothetical protein BH09PAT1_BH09PAT1_4650 [soil metagenome]